MTITYNEYGTPSEVPVIPIGGFVESTDVVRVRVKRVSDTMWTWCVNHAASGQWRYLFSIMGETATYEFKDSRDALAFKIQFYEWMYENE